jgi:hypothetical protein
MSQHGGLVDKNALWGVGYDYYCKRALGSKKYKNVIDIKDK